MQEKNSKTDPVYQRDKFGDSIIIIYQTKTTILICYSLTDSCDKMTMSLDCFCASLILVVPYSHSLVIRTTYDSLTTTRMKH